ncbi:RagB/SusD family nutrient uptake outer membrane protein [Ravibacter arvi]|uniref:RagB/SusD family nutrient uptake outer membrane protein n=1 Tax=Ravibacter arvi TaxID=2051041 RepID=A0ABP8LUQ3_9BACT
MLNRKVSFLYKVLSFTAVLVSFGSCREILEPPPVDLLVDDLVLRGPDDMDPVRIGLYNAVRSFGSATIFAGDFTPDYIQNNGTFTDYNELGTKQITAANTLASTLWGNIYSTIYIANFIDENIGKVSRVSQDEKDALVAQANFCRAYAYFIAAYSFGDVPKVTTTDVQTNRAIARAPQSEILALVREQYEAALEKLPERWDADNATLNKQFATKNAARAGLARYYLYQGEWANAEKMATDVINNKLQALDSSYVAVISTEFDAESIFEVAYGNTSSDDPGTSSTGLNNILVGRREVIPSNSYVAQLINVHAGTRTATISFSSANQQGRDNGWTVTKYGTPDQGNNNITIFRLAEMYLIRAEARAQQGKISGSSGALADVNVLRKRAKAPLASFTNQALALSTIETERLYELSFEGHRWYDLKRTGRLNAVMTAFSQNWNEKYKVWPIPVTEMQTNRNLKQNDGY